ncbi:uncharacterized protein LOC123260595 [Cotesia glomerata]|uniref:uncharacterized protein LOC123260595 n=1 Tax=Cotesia glomerata TaxID=32391 RepID=UPI001D006099|nr:uncharacterized protein LOC123260595 [Cotesia glomerata]
MVLKNSVLNAPSTETFSTDNPCTRDQEGAILSEADFIIRDIPNTTTTPSINNVTRGFQANDLRVPYSTFYHHKKAHDEFKNKIINNSFGHICSVCDRLWFKRDLKSASNQHQQILNTILPLTSIEKIALCTTCFTSLNKDKIPMMSVYNFEVILRI